MTRLMLLLALALATPAVAQISIDEARLPEPWSEIIADLNGDGAAEVIRAMPFDLDHDVISVTLGSGRFERPMLFAVWANRTGDPGVEQTSASSFLIRTGCFACGRTHSEVLHKIAWREGIFVVAGYTETITDRLFAVTVTCDVNHLSARAEIRVDGTLLASGVAAPRYPLAAWDAAVPGACEVASRYLSDSFLEDWAAQRDNQPIL